MLFLLNEALLRLKKAYHKYFYLLHASDELISRACKFGVLPGIICGIVSRASAAYQWCGAANPA